MSKIPRARLWLGAIAAAAAVAVVALVARGNNGVPSCATRSAEGDGGLNLAVGPQGLYAASGDRVLRLDLCSLKVTARQDLPRGEVGDVVANAAGVWVVSDDGSVRRFDPLSLELEARGRLPFRLRTSLLRTAVGTQLWVVDQPGGRVTEFDATTLKVRRTVSAPGRRFITGLAAHENQLWVTLTDGVVARIGSRGIAQTRQTGLAPGGLAYAQQDIWVLDESTGVLHRFDPTTLAVSPRTPTRVLLGTKTLARWTAVVASNDRLWALDEISDALVLVNPDRASPVRRDEIGRQPVALAAGASDAFVYDLEELRVLRFTSR
jgi:streptogramin lyase